MSEYHNWIAYVVETHDNLYSYTELELLQRYQHIISYSSYGAPSWDPWHTAKEYIVEIELVLGYTTGCMNDWDLVNARKADVEARIAALKPECEDDAYEILEYCGDGITPKRWWQCIDGKWVEYTQECPTCVCTPWADSNCISATERLRIRSCTPPGCDIEQLVVQEESCANQKPSKLPLLVSVGAIASGVVLLGSKI